MTFDSIEGVVVGTTAYADTHVIARLATRRRGKVSVMVRGGRSTKSKFGKYFQLGAHLRVDTRKGRGALANVSAVSAVSLPIRAHEDLIRIAYLAYGCEFVAALLVEDHENEKLFYYCWRGSLFSMERKWSVPRNCIQGEALTFSGLTPRLSGCGKCTDRLDDALVFSDANGGVMHQRCSNGTAVTAACLTTVEALRRTPLAEVRKTPLDHSAYTLLYGFFRYQTGRSLNGYSWLREVEGMVSQ